MNTVNQPTILETIILKPFSTGDVVILTGGTFSNYVLTLTNSNTSTVIVTGFTDTYTTGATFNPSNKIATFSRDDNNSYTLNLSSLTTADVYTTGATYNPATKISTFTRNDNATYILNLSSITTNDVFVTGGTFTGGTIIFQNNTGGTFVVSGITSISTDTTVTGGTYSNGAVTFKNNTGGTFNVTGFISSAITSTTLTNNIITATQWLGSTTATTINAATGGTYSNGIITLLGSGTLNNVTGLISANTFTTAFTYSNNIFTLTSNTGGTLSVIFNTVTGLTVNGSTILSGNSSSPILTVSGGSSTIFTISDNLGSPNLFIITTTAGTPVLTVTTGNTQAVGFSSTTLNVQAASNPVNIQGLTSSTADTKVISIDNTGTLHTYTLSAITNINIVTKTSSYTANTGDDVILVDCTSGPLTVTLPPAAGAGNQFFTIKKIDATANIATVTPTSGLIEFAASATLNTQGAAFDTFSNGTAYYIK